MSVTLTIPDDVIEPIKLPKDQVEKVIKKELAFVLYHKRYASMGVARRLSGLSKLDFIEGLGERKIERHYEQEDLEDDIEYAQNSK